MKAKFYFIKHDDEVCYREDVITDILNDTGLDEIVVFEAVAGKEEGVMFCKHNEQFGETGMCGNDCKDYNPKNGKSGCCKHYTRTIYESGKEVTISKK